MSSFARRGVVLGWGVWFVGFVVQWLLWHVRLPGEVSALVGLVVTVVQVAGGFWGLMACR